MKKTLTVILALVLVVVMSVAGTVAYLTSQATVTNTFSVGKVAITLDETKVTEYGDAVPSAAPVSANQYTLIPGHTYTKNPTVHVDADSEDCWLFVKVVNGISSLEATGATTIAAQLAANGWTPISEGSNIYAYGRIATKTDTNVPVFGSFTIADNATLPANGTGLDVVVTAYAIQADGFSTPAEAWTNAGLS